MERSSGEERAPAPRFTAHWVSPHGSVRIFLGVGRRRDEALRAARISMVRSGLGVRPRDEIRITTEARRRADPGTARVTSSRRASARP